MTSTSPQLPQESDLFELVIFGWKNRWSIFWGLCFGVVLALILTALKLRKSAGIVYQVKLIESLDDMYGAAPTGSFIMDLLQQERWNDYFYSQMKQLTPQDAFKAHDVLDGLIEQESAFGLSRNSLSSQGAIFTVRWPDEKIAAILNPLLPRALNQLAKVYNHEYELFRVKMQAELNALQNDQATAAAQILRLASTYYPASPALLNNPLALPREEGQIINFQGLVLVAGFIPDTEPSKKGLIDRFLLTQKNIKLLSDRRKAAFGEHSNAYQTQFISVQDSVSAQPIENENTAIRAQLWLTAVVSIAFGGLLGLGVSGLRSYYRLNRQRLWTDMNNKEIETVRGNG